MILENLAATGEPLLGGGPAEITITPGTFLDADLMVRSVRWDEATL